MNDDAPLSDDEELPDAALVRPYVETLGEFSGPPAPALPASEQPTALLPHISATMRKHGARMPPAALEGSVVSAELPPTPARARFAVAAVGVVVLLVMALLIWHPGSAGSKTPASPVAAVVPSLSLPAAPTASPTPQATRTPSKSPAKPARTPTPSAKTSATMSPLLAQSGDQDPGVDLALGRPVTDTGHAQNFVASNVVDGNPDTYWESVSNDFPQSLTIDLGAPMTVGRLVMRLPPLASWKTRTQWFSIQGSTHDDGGFHAISRLAVVTFDPDRGNDGSVQFRSTKCRYVRITFMGNSGLPAGQASEIELHSS